MKLSMVAMLGAIMPEPLAMPAMRTLTPSISASAKAPLANVSVVMMADAAAGQLSAATPSVISSSRAVIFSSGKSTPMTPVEPSITSFARQPIRLAAAATRLAAAAPGLPVKELAQPALTTRPRTEPSPDANPFLHQSTGAEPTPCLVKTPPQVVPAANRITSTSGRTCL